MNLHNRSDNLQSKKREAGLQLEFYTSQDMQDRTQPGGKQPVRINSKLVEAEKDKENLGDWANNLNTKFVHKNSKSIGS